ncbi:ATPase, T2SS/T4P/T4SS family [Saccharopolyspora sp. NPDC049426]|uniref:CpaF family protein n=1 Tax=Saccharopolyspora sp. NPDC049426 TaxID=3155652 RepID=UPI003445C605
MTSQISSPMNPADEPGAVPDADTVAQLRARVAERLAPGDDPARHRSLVAAEITAWTLHRAAQGDQPLSELAEKRLTDAVLAALSGLGDLQPLLEREDVENIHIHGYDRVWLERSDGSVQAWPHPVGRSDADLLAQLESMFARLGQTSREFSPAHPMGNLRLPAGGPLGARLAAVREVADRPRIAIRRHRLAHATLDDLHQRGTVNDRVHDFLQSAVRAGLNLLVTGGPAAGKTTLLRSLCHAITDHEHVVTVEDDYELGLHLNPVAHPLVTALEARAPNAEGAGEITLDDLLKQTLRHSPSRVIVGEVRGGEITSLLRALGNGAAGGMGTLHATSARAVPDRIAALSQLAHPPLSVAAAHRWTASALDLIVHVTRRDSEGRRERVVTEICEVGPVGDAGTPDLIPLFGPHPSSGCIAPVYPPSEPLRARLRQHGLDAQESQRDEGVAS